MRASVASLSLTRLLISRAAQGKRLVFVTNNSTKSRAGYTSKFKSLGLNVTAEEIFSSSFAAAAYLESTNFPKDKKARARLRCCDAAAQCCSAMLRSMQLLTRKFSMPSCHCAAQVYVVGEVGIEQELDLVVRLHALHAACVLVTCAHACFPFRPIHRA